MAEAKYLGTQTIATKDNDGSRQTNNKQIRRSTKSVCLPAALFSVESFNLLRLRTALRRCWDSHSRHARLTNICSAAVMLTYVSFFYFKGFIFGIVYLYTDYGRDILYTRIRTRTCRHSTLR